MISSYHVITMKFDLLNSTNESVTDLLNQLNDRKTVAIFQGDRFLTNASEYDFPDIDCPQIFKSHWERIHSWDIGNIKRGYSIHRRTIEFMGVEKLIDKINTINMRSLVKWMPIQIHLRTALECLSLFNLTDEQIINQTMLTGPGCSIDRSDLEYHWIVKHPISLLNCRKHTEQLNLISKIDADDVKKLLHFGIQFSDLRSNLDKKLINQLNLNEKTEIPDITVLCLDVLNIIREY